MRRDIQALRGIAVLLVLLFHFHVGPFKGGFLGVDVFFVISGYVTTERLSTGVGPLKSQLHQFYLRRAKRILPMSLLTTVVTTILVRLYLPPISYSRFFKDALAAVALIPNLAFAAQQNDYLSQSLDPSPFLHYWSLGVEEQFYFLWPLLFIFFFRKHRSWIPGLAVVGTTFGIWYTSHNSVQSFYLPTSRAWEFLVGAALVGVTWKTESTTNRRVVALVGWMGILASALVISTNNPTPSWSTIVPILATGLVLWAAAPFSDKYLLPQLGDYSYSLYLIHWPLITVILFKYPNVSLSWRVALIPISIAVAYLATNYFEKPLRFNKKISLPLWKWASVMVVGAALSTLILGTAAASYKGVTKDLTISTASPIIYSNGCHVPFAQSVPKTNCIYGDATSKISIVLAGDSHAAQWFPALNALSTKHHWRLISLTKSSCPATILATMRSGIADKNCLIWQQNLISSINTIKPTLVITSAFTESPYPLVQPEKDYAIQWVNGLQGFYSKIVSPNTKELFIGDTPYPRQDEASCLSAHLTKTKMCDFGLMRSAASLATMRFIQSSVGTFIDPTGWLCSNGICGATRNGFNTYRDISHLSVPTSENLALQLDARLVKILNS